MHHVIWKSDTRNKMLGDFRKLRHKSERTNNVTFMYELTFMRRMGIFEQSFCCHLAKIAIICEIIPTKVAHLF